MNEYLTKPVHYYDLLKAAHYVRGLICKPDGSEQRVGGGLPGLPYPDRLSSPPGKLPLSRNPLPFCCRGTENGGNFLKNGINPYF